MRCSTVLGGVVLLLWLYVKCLQPSDVAPFMGAVDAALARNLQHAHIFVITSDGEHAVLYGELLAVGVRRKQITLVPAVAGKKCRRVGRAVHEQHGVDRARAVHHHYHDGLGCSTCGCDAAQDFCRHEAAETFACADDNVRLNVTAPFLKRPAALNELGCTAAHLIAIRAVFDANIEWGLVLEDDASLALVSEWGIRGLQATIDSLPAAWGVLQCHIHFGTPRATIERMTREWLGGKLARRRTHTGDDRQLWSTVAYAVSRRGAQDLLGRYWTEHGAAMDVRRNPLVDVLVYSGPQTFAATRPLFEHKLRLNGTHAGSASSSIHTSHDRNHKINQHLVLKHFYANGVQPPSWWLFLEILCFKAGLVAIK